MADSKPDRAEYTEIPESEDAAGKNKANGDGPVRLKAEMSLLNGISVIVGSIIGSGIFISPTGVLQYAGSVNLSIIVWVLSGVFSMIGAYCYAELGCMISKSGADYAYIMQTFGPFLAFIRLWVECMIVRPCSQAIVALTFSKYVQKAFFDCSEPPTESTRLLAASCICLLAFINCYSVKWSTRVQDVFTFAKLLALFIIIGTGIYQLSTGHVGNFTFTGSESDITKISLAFYSGLFAYSGWNYLNFVIEELKEPNKNLPRAIAISLTLVTVVYIMTNVAFYTTLSPQEVLRSSAVAVDFADRLFGSFAWIIPVFVAMSTFGAVNGILLTSSRLFFAGAMEGQMPEILTMIQVPRMTPTPAILSIAILSLIYLCSDNVYGLITYLGFATWLSIGLAVFCIPYLRWKRPDLARPIRVNLLFPVLYIIATLFISVVSIIASPIETGYGALMILTAVPIYYFFIAWKNKPECMSYALAKSTIALQKFLVVITPE